MKNSLILASTLLLAPVAAQAQFAGNPAPELAPSLQLPRTPAQTPALNAFAGMNTQLQLQARWVRIDSANLPKNLPAWNKDGAWSHVATPEELKRLELLIHTGIASVDEQQLRALNNHRAALSFPPFTSVRFVQSSAPNPGPIDDMILPREKPGLDTTQPYIPNLAKPHSRLPEMAPMPGINGKLDPPFIAPLPARDSSVRPQMSHESADSMAYKFQISPTISGEQIALELYVFYAALRSARDVSAMATAKAKLGETVVFSLPNMVEFIESEQSVDGFFRLQTRRTFLLVTPRIAPQPTIGLK